MSDGLVVREDPSRSRGAVRLSRFALVVTPAVVACLGVVAAIVLGWVSVALASARPLDLRTSHGTADRMSLGVGTDQSVTGLRPTDDPRGVAVMRVEEADMADLCLVPRADVPLLGRMLSLKIRSGSTVRIGSVDLAASAARLTGLGLPRTRVGTDLRSDAPAGALGGVVMATDDEQPHAVVLDGVGVSAYGLELDQGIDLRSLSLVARLGDQHC